MRRRLVSKPIRGSKKDSSTIRSSRDDSVSAYDMGVLCIVFLGAEYSRAAYSAANKANNIKCAASYIFSSPSVSATSVSAMPIPIDRHIRIIMQVFVLRDLFLFVRMGPELLRGPS
jgi:hypothetical protein